MRVVEARLRNKNITAVVGLREALGVALDDVAAHWRTPLAAGCAVGTFHGAADNAVVVQVAGGLRRACASLAS